MTSNMSYVGYGVYVMGSLSCAICGNLFPLTTSSHDDASCESCGARHCPSENLLTSFKRSRDANDVNINVNKKKKVVATNTFTSEQTASPELHSALHFTKSEVNAARRRVQCLLGQGMQLENEANSIHVSPASSTSQTAAAVITKIAEIEAIPSQASKKQKICTNKVSKTINSDFSKGKKLESKVNIKVADNATATNDDDDNNYNNEDVNVTNKTAKQIVDKKRGIQKKRENIGSNDELGEQNSLPASSQALPASKFANVLKRAKVGTVAVDHRVIEEAFCEQCQTHRPCWTFARQTRSADEGQTIFFQCTKCLSEWQQNS